MILRLNTFSLTITIRNYRWKEEAEAREMERCTFSPSISRLAEASGSARDKNIHEVRDIGYPCLRVLLYIQKQITKSFSSILSILFQRLYSEAALVSTRLKAKAEMIEVEKLKDCTFKPSVGKTPSTSGAVHERLFAHATCSAEKRLQAMLDLRNIDANCTFTPITNNDVMLDPKRTEALYKMGVDDQRARAQSPRDYSKALSERIEAEDLNLCTFVPDRSQTKSADPLTGITTTATFGGDGKSAPLPPIPPTWEYLPYGSDYISMQLHPQS